MVTFVITLRLHPINSNKNVVRTDTILYLLNHTVHIDIYKHTGKLYIVLISILHTCNCIIKNNADPSVPLGAFWSGFSPFSFSLDLSICILYEAG